MFNDIRSEKEIEKDFFKRLAQGLPDELPDMGGAAGGLGSANVGDLGGGLPDVGDLGETLAPGEPGDGEAGLTAVDTDQAEMQAVKDLIPWDSFVILMDPHYAKLLQDSLSLPEPKAKSKSFYIYYSPENKRIEGIVNKRYVGGYGQKEQLGEDFAYLKTLSEQGFHPDWKEKLLSDIDELPAVENSKVKDELRMKQKQDDEDGEDKEKLKVDESEESAANAENEIETEPQDEMENEDAMSLFPKKKKPAGPVPVGKVDTSKLVPASINDMIKMRRFARFNKYKAI